MRNAKKRALILTAVIFAFSTQLAACKSESSYARYNEGAYLSNIHQSMLDTFQAEPGSALEWLRNNLDSIRRGLLMKNYENTISILLEKQKELANNEYYNALLYIAYMGSGDEASANALLENKNLNEEIFIQCVVECAEILDGNEEIRTIMERLVPPETEPADQFQSGRPNGGGSGAVPPKESAPEESKPEESAPEESKPEESTPAESTPGESTPEESKPEESTPGESTPGESTPEESKPEESKPEENKPEENKPEESTPQGE